MRGGLNLGSGDILMKEDNNNIFLVLETLKLGNGGKRKSKASMFSNRKH